MEKGRRTLLDAPAFSPEVRDAWKHAANCADCREAVEEYSALAGLLSEEPPPELEAAGERFAAWMRSLCSTSGAR